MKPTWQTADGAVQLFLGDCLTILPHLGRVDAVVTDPDYGTGGWRRESSGMGQNPSAKLVREAWDAGEFLWIDGRWPVAAFCAASTVHRMLARAMAAGLTKHRCLYWRKPDPKPMPAGRVRWSVEPIWTLARDGFQLYGGDDWIVHSAIRENRDDESLGHPYQKPIEVVEWLLGKLRCRRVCDPFMGSGTTGAAAVRGGLEFVGIEKEPRYFEIAVTRIEAELNRAPLFEPPPQVQKNLIGEDAA